MTTSFEELVNDFKQLKTVGARLQEEIQFLKENYRALVYLLEDSIASKEELIELERIDRLVETGNLEEFEELK